MRILMCASEAPLPPENGFRLQLRALATALAGRHEVTVLAARWPDQYGAVPPGVELVELAAVPAAGVGRVAGWVRAAARREPIEALRLTGPMAAAIRALLSKRVFDVAHVSPGHLAGVAPALGGLPAILVPLDAWTLNVRAQHATARGPRRHAIRVHDRLVRHFVSQAYRPYARIVLVSEEDARETCRLDPWLCTAVVPNGVDAERFHPGAAGREPDRLVFTGALHAPANVHAAEWLAHRVLPRVRAARPDARLALVGRAPTSAIRGLGGIAGVDVVGEVADVRPWLWCAQAFACPMRTGTGMKNKLLEALACACPTVASSLACRGLEVRDDEELLVADEETEFAAALVRLLTHPELGERLGLAGREHVLARHKWGAVARAYERLYAEAVDSG